MTDKLTLVLQRALRRAAQSQTAKHVLSAEAKAKRLAEDYANRLAEKHLYRGLLSDERFDGLRFRWYFTHIAKDVELDQLRAWIDAKVSEEDSRAKAKAMAPKSLRHPRAPASPEAGRSAMAEEL